MYTKTVTFTKTSCKGKVFKCTKTYECYDEREMRAIRKAREAEIRAYREYCRRLDEFMAEKNFPHHGSMDMVIDAYDEYVRNVKDFYY